MIGSFSFTEIAFILILALVIFGPKRLPEIGKLLGRGLGEFRKASNELRRTFNAEMSLEEDEPKTPMRRAPRLSTAALSEAPQTGSSGAGSEPTLAAPAGVIAQGSATPGSAVADSATPDSATPDGATQDGATQDGATAPEPASGDDSEPAPSPNPAPEA